jgi:hypothetical protein
MRFLSLLSVLFLSVGANAFTVNWSTTNPTTGVGPLSGSFSWTNSDPASIGTEVNNKITAAMNQKCSQQCVNRVGIPGSTNYSSGSRIFTYTPNTGGYTGTPQTYTNPNAITISCSNVGAQNYCASDPRSSTCAVSGSKTCSSTQICAANGPSAANVTCTVQNQSCDGPLTGQVIGTCSKPADANGSTCAQSAKTPDSCVPGSATIPAAVFTKANSSG